MIHSIYLIKNKVSGKVYIGLTKHAIVKRWSQHKSDAFNGSECPIHRAIRKYGAENFFILSLETELSKKEACEKEKFYIAKYGSTDSSIGYNASTGGESGRTGVKPWNFGKSKKDSIAMKNISLRQTAENNSFYGKTHSDELKVKWSKERTGLKLKARPEIALRNRQKIWTNEEKRKISLANSKPIKCVNTGIRYESITKACFELNLDPRSVQRVLKGKFKQTKGYSFVYTDKEQK